MEELIPRDAVIEVDVILKLPIPVFDRFLLLKQSQYCVGKNKE